MKRIHGATWEWRDTEAVRDRGLPPGATASGVIAQGVEAAFPELVSIDPDGYKRVDYNGLIAVLLEAVKELAARLEVLEQAKPR